MTPTASVIPIVRVKGNPAAYWHESQTRYDQNDLRVRKLQSSFDRTVENDALLSDIVARLAGWGVSAGVLGGWVRDHCLAFHCNQHPMRPRDLDLVAIGQRHDDLLQILPTPTSRTALGGMSFQSTTSLIDLWGGDDTLLIQRLGLSTSAAQILAVTDFNINAAIFFPRQLNGHSLLLDAGCLGAIERRCIDFHFDHLPFPVVQVARLCDLAFRLDFALSDNVQAFITKVVLTYGYRAISDNLFHFRPDSAIGALERLRRITAISSSV